MVDPSLNVEQLHHKYGPPSGLAPCQLAVLLLFGTNLLLTAVLETHIWLSGRNAGKSGEEEDLLLSPHEGGDSEQSAAAAKVSEAWFTWCGHICVVQGYKAACC